MKMQEELIERIKSEADYIIKNDTTIRLTARRFGLSKTTIHTDVTQKLFYINKTLYKKVRRVLDNNISQRAIRGGRAVKKKYKKQS